MKLAVLLFASSAVMSAECRAGYLLTDRAAADRGDGEGVTAPPMTLNGH